jgi:hypothetical protein
MRLKRPNFIKKLKKIKKKKKKERLIGNENGNGSPIF